MKGGYALAAAQSMSTLINGADVGVAIISSAADLVPGALTSALGGRGHPEDITSIVEALILKESFCAPAAAQSMSTLSNGADAGVAIVPSAVSAALEMMATLQAQAGHSVSSTKDPAPEAQSGRTRQMVTPDQCVEAPMLK